MDKPPAVMAALYGVGQIIELIEAGAECPCLLQERHIFNKSAYQDAALSMNFKLRSAIR
jgi:hypothetical protein